MPQRSNFRLNEHPNHPPYTHSVPQPRRHIPKLEHFSGSTVYHTGWIIEIETYLCENLNFEFCTYFNICAKKECDFELWRHKNNWYHNFRAEDGNYWVQLIIELKNWIRSFEILKLFSKNVSKILFLKIHNFKVTFFTKFIFSKIPFFTKFTFSKSHFSQNSQF